MGKISKEKLDKISKASVEGKLVEKSVELSEQVTEQENLIIELRNSMLDLLDTLEPLIPVTEAGFATLEKLRKAHKVLSNADIKNVVAKTFKE